MLEIIYLVLLGKTKVPDHPIGRVVFILAGVTMALMVSAGLLILAADLAGKLAV